MITSIKRRELQIKAGDHVIIIIYLLHSDERDSEKRTD